MCGIVGFMRWNGPRPEIEEIEHLTRQLAHRGPDGAGTEVRGSVALGHRRLSIIDLEGGRQPLSNEDGTVWITYNGELYNFQDLRVELEARGHRFRTRSDTEVVVHAYEEWGDACVERFRGMFAFGILDERKRRLFLARDHLGIKPLYYLRTDSCFAFASELQALRPLRDVTWRLDLQAIDQYLTLQYIPAPQTIFKDVFKLPPAHRVSVDFDGHLHGAERYWNLQFRPDHRRSEAETIAQLDDVLRQSVKAHLVSDVPFGAFLSGGVDSSAIVAYMSRLLSQPVKTFTIGFEEEEFSELKYAEDAARRIGTEHHFEVVKPDALEILPQLARHYGEPFGDSSAVPTYYVSRMARKHVPMILSGDGGDENFAGYVCYMTWMQNLALTPPRVAARGIMRKLMGLLFPRRFMPLSPMQPSLENWVNLVSYVRHPNRMDLWRTELRDVCTPIPPAFERIFQTAKTYPSCSRIQYMDLHLYLPYDILTKVDVASMVHGLEVRTPLVDRCVAEFAATIPQEMLIYPNKEGVWEGKHPLKKLLARDFSEAFLRRPKMGFSVPVAKWFSSEGAYRRPLEDRLLSPSSPLNEYFNARAIRWTIEANHSGPVWLLLFLDEWLRQNRNGTV